MSESFVYTIGKTEDLKDFSVNDIFHVKDKKEKNVSICKLYYDDKLFLIETPFLKVIYIEGNEIHVELNEISLKELNVIDEKLCELLENVVNLPECQAEIYDKINDLNFSTIVKKDNYIKLFVDNDTNIMSNKKKINIEEIEIGNMIQLCFLLESINIYPELDLSGIKTSCKVINLHKEYKPTKLEINEFTFSYEESKEFEKPIVMDQDVDFFNTIKVKEDEKIVDTIIIKDKKKRGRKPKNQL